MEHIEKSIENYLSKDTDYAFLITGAWGIGKTHFLKEQINRISAAKKQKFALISLYGVNSVKEISNLIFLEKYPIAKSKFVKYGGKLAQLFAKGIDFGDLMNVDWDADKKTDLTVKSNEVISDLGALAKSEQENFKPDDNLILCFDDFERKGDNLKDTELVGYIDNIVQKGIKVIILSNQEVIKTESYNSLKEKTFGVVVEYKPDLINIVNEITKNKFKKIESIVFQNQQIIEETFLKNSQNLRILKFALSHFEDVHKVLVEREKNDYEILQEILKFTLAIAIEYREGHITYSNRKGIDTSNFLNFEDYFQITKHIDIVEDYDKKSIENNDKYKGGFKAKYFNNYEDIFFESVYNHVTGGYLDKDLLLEEVQKIADKRRKPQYEIYRTISDLSNLCQLEDNEYVDLLNEIVEYMEKGLFDDINEYNNVIYWVLYRNALQIPEQVIVDKGLSGYKNFLSKSSMKRIRDDKSRIPNIIMLSSITETAKQFLKQALKLIEDEEVVRIQKDMGQIDEILSKNTGDFTNLIFEQNKDNPIFNLITIEQLYEKINSMKNAEIQNFNQLLEKRYRKRFDFLVSEKTFLSNLKTFLETANHKKWEDKPLKKMVLNQLQGTIEEIFEYNKYALKNLEPE